QRLEGPGDLRSAPRRRPARALRRFVKSAARTQLDAQVPDDRPHRRNRLALAQSEAKGVRGPRKPAEILKSEIGHQKSENCPTNGVREFSVSRFSVARFQDYQG